MVVVVTGGSVSNHLSHSVLFDEMEVLNISRPGGEDLDLGGLNMTDDGHDGGEGMSIDSSGQFSSLSIAGSVINKPEGLGFDSQVGHMLHL